MSSESGFYLFPGRPVRRAGGVHHCPAAWFNSTLGLLLSLEVTHE
jgi:hypothetical protein